MITFSQTSLLITKTTMTGVRCIVHNDKCFVSAREKYHHCVIRCMHKGCPFLNYNMVEQSCLLGEENCLFLKLDIDYNLTSFVPLAESCLQWISATGSDPTDLVSSYRCHHIPDADICYVGRLIFGTHTLPGKYYRLSGDIHTCFGGESYTSGQREVLTVVGGCHVAWVPYTAGNEIPVGAFVGVFLDSGLGSHLFVIRGEVSTYIMIGYYDPITQKGYIEFYGCNVLTEMEMLVLVWLHICTHYKAFR